MNRLCRIATFKFPILVSVTSKPRLMVPMKRQTLGGALEVASEWNTVASASMAGTEAQGESPLYFVLCTLIN
jgi:hypothetical protein